MEVTLTIPDDVVADLQNGSNQPLSRRLLEFAVIKAHEADLITERQVMEILGFKSRVELYEFFKQHDVRSNYTLEDLERDSAALSALLNRQ
jgi:hypothetical protein